MKNYKINVITAIALLFWQVPAITAQNVQPELTQQEKSAVVDSIAKQLKANYIFPEVADKMTEKMKASLKKGEYKSITDPREFADKLTKDLLSVSNDRHVGVMFDPEGISQQRQAVTKEDNLELLNRDLKQMKQNNFGFKEVKILDGNIGYLNLTEFSKTEYAGETAVAAMNFLSNTDALIIDLRNNGGGSPSMIQLITSYFYEGEPIHLNDFYWRPDNVTTQSWTLPHVPGKRRPDMDIYILTSNRTFSAAEEFCYNLKNLGRATLIGETTGGGAHPGGPVIATDRFRVWIPTGRAINPITKTNWEGTGVSPHIETAPGIALETAQIKALEELMKNNKESEAYYNWFYQGLKAVSSPVKLEASVLKSFEGKYAGMNDEQFGARTIRFENDKLSYQRGSGPKFELIAFSQNEFIVNDLTDFRLKFIIENNKVVAMQRFFDNGESDKLLKAAE